MSDAFSDDEKGVFAYRNHAGEEVFADPIHVARELAIALDGDADGVLKAARGREPGKGPDGKPLPLDPLETPDEVVQRLTAEKLLYRAVRTAFGLPPFDPVTGSGATERHCEVALNHYFFFLAKREKRDAN